MSGVSERRQLAHERQGRGAPTFGGPTDAALMLAVGAGDVSALEVLMDRHWRPLIWHVYRSLGHWDDAEDVAQEAFVRLWEARRRWAPGGSARAYLYRVARNLVVDRFRHEEVRGRAARAVLRLPSPASTPADDAIGAEVRSDFEGALSSLPPRRREAFLLVRFQGLTLREAAEAMGLTPRTVANHIYLAATDLEEALRPHLS